MRKRAMHALRPIAMAISCVAAGTAAHAEPSLTGQTGLIYMPDARLDPDGTWRTGVSYADPYTAIWTSLTALPRLEASFRYTRIAGVPGFSDRPDTNYGDFKDKTFDAKFLLIEEDRLWPALALGGQDIGGGTGIFRAAYATAGKKLWDLDFTVGYGADRIDGAFGGVRYSPNWLPHWSLVAEYDANNYARDVGARLTGVNQREKEIVAGIEYRRGWVGLQASHGHDEYGVNAYLAIPLHEKEWIPKINEPEPYVKISPRPSIAQWNSDLEHEKRMVQALHRQDFRDVRVELQGDRITAVLTNVRISQMSRAAGRAARTILNLAPVEIREIRIVYTVAGMPFATYIFVDVKRLGRYFNGQIGRPELSDYVLVEYAKPTDGDLPPEKKEILASLEIEAKSQFFDRTEGDLYSFRTESASLDRFKLSPRFSLYLNDPSGAFHYDVFAEASYVRKLADKTFFNSAARVTIVEDVSGVTQPSNSLLPHVRTDIADYYRENGPKITQLTLNRFFQPGQQVYVRTSAGIYELMFAGAGGQVLYVPQQGRWASDLSVDWVKQRDFRGFFGFRDYDTVTALAALHYRMPFYGLTTTVRAGRFLASDNGARFEIKRQFNSGIEIGAWYTVTDGNDITSPGTPSKPYYDKGIFANIPLRTLLARDTQAVAVASISPWTRDVGQMVASPGDLYGIVENPLRNKATQDGLIRFGDLEDDPYAPPPPNAIKEAANWDVFRYYVSEGTASLFSEKTLLFGLGAVAAVGLSYTLDDDVDKRGRDHRTERLNKG
ncbi:MAG: YjbH domain-containing protein, partial [Burkholderiales bacterium]